MKFQHNKALGQHFLTDDDIINNIIANSHNLANYNVLEIGPGNGALTIKLLEKSKSVLSIEKDVRLKTNLLLLKEQHANFNFILGDALNLNPLEHIGSPRVLIANLPYNVGTQIFLNYLHEAKALVGNFDYFILMLQKEVAQRIVANAGDNHYGRLSIISNLLADCELLFYVPKESFDPAPKVESAGIKITPLKQPRYKVDIGKLEKITSSAFSGRRKTIRNSLKMYNVDFETLAINSGKRAEEIAVADFCKISNSLLV